MERRAGALGELAAVLVHEQRQVGEAGQHRAASTSGVEGGHDVDLDAGVGDVVLAADDVGDAGLQVIHDTGEGVEGGAVGADEHGVGDGGELHAAGAEHHVAPFRRVAGEEEAPVGALAAGLGAGTLLGRELEHGAVIDGGLVALGALVPLGGEFLLGLEAGVEAAGGFQLLGRGGVEGQAVGLVVGLVPGEAHPGEVVGDGVGVLGAVALPIGVVEAEEEGAAVALGEEVVGERDAGVADVEEAGGAGSEAEFHGVG